MMSVARIGDRPSSNHNDVFSISGHPLTAPMSKPLLSIIVPSFNQGRFIRHTLDSCLAQKHKPIEIIVIDGGSTDGTIDVLRGYGQRPELRWWSEPDRGVADAVNKGLARASGDIAAIQSSDDAYLPGAFEHIVAAFEQSPDVGLVYGDIATVDAAGVELSRSTIPAFSLEGFLAGITWVPQPSAFFRLDLARSLGGWNERYFVADTEMWLRMGFRTSVRKLDVCLAERRKHGEQRDRQSRAIRDSYRRMIGESGDLKRAASRLRRAARCGCHMISIRYNPSGSDWAATWHLWNAVLNYPRVMSAVGRTPLWVPGYLPLRRLLSTVKRGICGAASVRRGRS